MEAIFTVTGRSDAGGCNSSTALPQPSFATAVSENDIIYRIPTPTFGAGLIENLDDSTLLNNQVVNLKNHFGISGTFNRNGNDGTITRFGWKGQNKSLHIFSGEAYNVEMGISNLLFTQDRPLPGEDGWRTGLPPNCLNLSGSGYPEDASNPGATGRGGSGRRLGIFQFHARPGSAARRWGRAEWIERFRRPSPLARRCSSQPAARPATTRRWAARKSPTSQDR